MRRLRVTLLALLAAAIGIVSGADALSHPGWGIAVDREGNVYYTDLAQVWKTNGDGRTRKTIVVPGVHTHELYLDPDGALHGGHLWYDDATSKWGGYSWVQRGGKIVRGAAQDGLDRGESLVRDRTGAMYSVQGSRIRKRLPGGEIIDVAGIPRPADAKGPAPGGILAARDDGTLYLLSGGDLLRVDPGGRIARMASGLAEHVWTAFMTQPWHDVMGLTPDDRGRVYVANAGARKVKRIDLDGRVTVVLRSRWPWAPTGIAVRGADLYVLEYTDTGGSVRVRKLDEDGRVTTLR